MKLHSIIKIDTNDQKSLREIEDIIEDRTGESNMGTIMSFTWSEEYLEIKSKIGNFISIILSVFSFLFPIVVIFTEVDETQMSRGMWIAWGPMVGAMMFLVVYLFMISDHRQAEKMIRDIIGRSS